ncbi:MAG: hypothetical protein N2Z23_07255 [Pyrinomonadaceae bacterium]|nr:hypothetical protein [Pyrinomonadaceae bacterium]MCX7640222.1 hypothetical protein [Pyrinomonadaceae bacterium]MDW8303933.1 arginine-tRNA-protein transferase [Acidobacteriota bacterium]
MAKTQVNEDFISCKVSPEELDELLAKGWRHFGIYFFRYSLVYHENKLYHVLPLRIRLEKFKLSKSLRRILRKNSDLEHKIHPVKIGSEEVVLFEQHKTRFKRNPPNSIYDFICPISSVPCQVMQLSVFLNKKLVACSFFDVGLESVSSIYAMFDLNQSKRSLGIFTMLLEINFAVESKKKFFYQGYAYKEKSFYDYKKRFHAVEAYDWNSGEWKELNQRELLEL